ncbi:MAG: Ig-like domain-containing protein [Thermoplasmatota archaeon]
MLRAVLLPLLLLTAALSVAGPSMAADVTVDVGSNFFDPDEVTIDKGDTVTWTWVGGFHDVTAGTPGAPGEEWCSARGGTSAEDCDRTFTAAGLFDYYCTIHPAGMQATVIVRGAAPNVAITSPADGATVTGVTTVTGTAAAEAGIDLVEVAVDDGPWMAATGTGSWSFDLNTAAYDNGAHTLRARVTALDRQVTETAIAVVADNLQTVDLAIDLFRADNQNLNQGTSTLTLRVANDGNLPVAATALLEYSANGAWHTIDTVAFEIGALGATTTLRTDWSPVGALGQFDVRATLDPDDEHQELSEANNQATTKAAIFTRFVPGTDLLTLA